MQDNFDYSPTNHPSLSNFTQFIRNGRGGLKKDLGGLKKNLLRGLHAWCLRCRFFSQFYTLRNVQQQNDTFKQVIRILVD